MFVKPCAIVAFLFLLLHFLVFWPIGLRPIWTLWSLSLSIHLGPHQRVWITLFLHVYACLLLCFMHVLTSLDLGFAMLDALSGFVVVWLHLMPMRHCLGVTIWKASPNAGLLRAYPSFFASVQCHACLRHPLAFYAFLHTCSHVQA